MNRMESAMGAPKMDRLDKPETWPEFPAAEGDHGSEAGAYDYEESDQEVATAGTGSTEMSRRGALGVLAGVVASLGVGTDSAEARHGRRPEARRDYDSPEYIRTTKELMQAWYVDNKGRIEKKVRHMQAQMDADPQRRPPATVRHDFAPIAGKHDAFSAMWMTISYVGLEGGRYRYNIEFFVREKNNDVDCGKHAVYLRPLK